MGVVGVFYLCFCFGVEGTSVWVCVEEDTYLCVCGGRFLRVCLCLEDDASVCALTFKQNFCLSDLEPARAHGWRKTEILTFHLFPRGGVSGRGCRSYRKACFRARPASACACRASGMARPLVMTPCPTPGPLYSSDPAGEKRRLVDLCSRITRRNTSRH